MVIDTSALLAILLSEPELVALSTAIFKSKNRYMSAVSLLEASIVLQLRLDGSPFVHLDGIVQKMEIDIVAFDNEQTLLARNAYKKFGKRNHKAKLNFGDCCSYALAKHLNEKLLFKGNDFGLTDVKIAAY